MRKPGALVVAVTLVFGMGAAACGEKTPIDVFNPVTTTTLPEASPLPIQPGDTPVGAHTAFTVELFRAVATKRQGNLVLSPHGVDIVLSMLLEGARGTTADELRNGLHGIDPRELARLERTLRGRSGEGVTVELASSEWLQEDFAVRSEYRRFVEGTFGAEPHEVDFAEHNKKATEAINNHVAEKTHGYIPRLFDDPLDPLTRLVLVSTAYLHARWAAPFSESSTTPMPFTLLDGSRVPRPTMHQTAQYATAAGDGWRAVSLPYEGGALSMLVVVPDDLESFQAQLTPALMSRIGAAANTPKRVELTMPKFEFRTGGSLKGELAALGMKTMLTDAADLTGIAPPQPDPLKVTDVVQQAWVQVDERGTKAAAATGLVAGVTSAPRQDPPERFAVDRPFVFAVRDNPTGAVLFIGRVVDPAQA